MQTNGRVDILNYNPYDRTQSIQVSQEMKDKKLEQKVAKVRADNVYFDSLTEKDIAWG